ARSRRQSPDRVRHSLGRCKVGEMGRLVRSHHLAPTAAWGRTEWAAAAHLGKRRRAIVASDNSQKVVLAEIERAGVGLPKPGRVRQHSCKYRPELARRAGYDLQHLRRCCLLIQRLAQVVGALTQLVEQARVLDGDDGLTSEVRD